MNCHLLISKPWNYMKKTRKRLKAFLTEYSGKKGIMVMERAIKLGDFLWTKYDEKF